MLLAGYLWQQVNLSDIVQKHCKSNRQKFDVAETAFVLVANRLCEPSSEHGLARWLEHTSPVTVMVIGGNPIGWLLSG